MWGVMSLLISAFSLIVLDHLPKALTAHALAVHVDKQGLLVLVSDDAGPDILHVVLQRLDGGRIQRHDALLVLAPASDEACGQVDVTDVQTDELRHADTGGVQQLQHGVVTEPLLIHALGLF